jgi:hypothetical protein
VGAEPAVEIVERVYGLAEVASVPEALDDLRSDPEEDLLAGLAVALELRVQRAAIVFQRDGVVIRREVEIS